VTIETFYSLFAENLPSELPAIAEVIGMEAGDRGLA
jgi:hypothetical protein